MRLQEKMKLINDIIFPTIDTDIDKIIYLEPTTDDLLVKFRYFIQFDDLSPTKFGLLIKIPEESDYKQMYSLIKWCEYAIKRNLLLVAIDSYKGMSVTKKIPDEIRKLEYKCNNYSLVDAYILHEGASYPIQTAKDLPPELPSCRELKSFRLS